MAFPNLNFNTSDPATATSGGINQNFNLGSGSASWPFSSSAAVGSGNVWKYVAIGLLGLTAFYIFKRHH